MNKPDINLCPPVLQSMDRLLREDGFILASASAEDAHYSRRNAGWTTRVRALVVNVEDACCYTVCGDCHDEQEEALMHQAEMKRYGVRHCVDCNLEPLANGAANFYLEEARPLVYASPLRIHRTRRERRELHHVRWTGTPSKGMSALKYIGTCAGCSAASARRSVATFLCLTVVVVKSTPVGAGKHSTALPGLGKL